MNELIKKFEALLSAAITPENILFLKQVYDEIKSSKDVFISKIDNPRIDFLEGRKEWKDIYKSVDEEGIEIGLTVMDKESISGINGLKKYSFGYALDSKKPFEGENIIKAFEAHLFENLKVDSVVVVKTKAVEPVLDGKFYTVKMESPFFSSSQKTKLNSAKEIIRKAFASKALNMSKETAAGLIESRIISMDIDKEFGIEVDKHHSFKKAAGFLENGIVYAIVYPVNEKDTDGDYATPEEVLKACWKFMSDFQKFNYMHADDLSDRDVSLVECACALADAPDYGVKKGDWYIAVQVHNLDLRKKIESEEITGFSMEGSAKPGEPIKELQNA